MSIEDLVKDYNAGVIGQEQYDKWIAHIASELTLLERCLIWLCQRLRF